MSNGNKASTMSRRAFVQRSTAGLTYAAALPLTLGSEAAKANESSSNVHNSESSADNQRALNAFKVRKKAAKNQATKTLGLDKQYVNDDEQRYRDARFYASFSKTLPHNKFGEVAPAAFRRMRRALRSGKQVHFNNIPIALNATRKLENPQGAFRYTMAGLDSHATRIPPAPAFSSAVTAAEVGELYWQASSRDVPFIDYSSNELINKAADDLNAFSQTVGPKHNNQITPATIFRGETAGDLTGPYISQFFYQPVPYGPTRIEQRYEVPLAGVDFMTNNKNWLNIQRGRTPLESAVFDTQHRYIYNNRALGEYVHRDVLFQAYFNAAMILLSYGADALSANNPYLGNPSNQTAFTTYGGPFILDMLSQAANLALSGAWFQKWRVHRRLRPEVFGGRIHHKLTNQRDYEIHSDILNSQAIAHTLSTKGSLFLPMAYIEGSPTHPAYPAGHATIAGACCTILKACFNENYILPNAVQANHDGTQLLSFNQAPLTIGNEVNKLAANMSLGRNAAGVHYRSDGIDGISAGEQQAIALLQDYSICTNEDTPEFSFTKFDGTPITILDGEMIRG